MHHLGHHWAALLSVGIGVFTALAIVFWGALQQRADSDYEGPQ